jgi:hypothetical protein
VRAREDTQREWLSGVAGNGSPSSNLEYVQTLTRHAKFSDDAIEEPVEGYHRGDYVAIRARKPS